MQKDSFITKKNLIVTIILLFSLLLFIPQKQVQAHTVNQLMAVFVKLHGLDDAGNYSSWVPSCYIAFYVSGNGQNPGTWNNSSHQLYPAYDKTGNAVPVGAGSEWTNNLSVVWLSKADQWVQGSLVGGVTKYYRWTGVAHVYGFAHCKYNRTDMPAVGSEADSSASSWVYYDYSDYNLNKTHQSTYNGIGFNMNLHHMGYFAGEDSYHEINIYEDRETFKYEAKMNDSIKFPANKYTSPNPQTITDHVLYDKVHSYWFNEPTRPGYTFKYWSNNAGGTANGGQNLGKSFNGVACSQTSDHGQTRYAIWEATTQDIKYYNLDGTDLSSKGWDISDTVAYPSSFKTGQTVIIQVPENTYPRMVDRTQNKCFTFKGWANNNTSTAKPSNGKYTIDGWITNQNLYGFWDENPYTINYHANGGIAISNPTTTNKVWHSKGDVAASISKSSNTLVVEKAGYGHSTILSPASNFTRTGHSTDKADRVMPETSVARYELVGWTTSPYRYQLSFPSNYYTAGENADLTVNEAKMSIDLYAVWKKTNTGFLQVSTGNSSNMFSGAYNLSELVNSPEADDVNSKKAINRDEGGYFDDQLPTVTTP